MKNIQYVDILKQAFLLTWKNKFLWVFGFLILLGSFGSNLKFNGGEGKVQQSKQLEDLMVFMQTHPTLFGILGLLLITIVVILFLLRLLAMAGIIKSANDINLYRQLSIVTILKESKKYLGRLLLLELAIGFGLILIMIVLATPVLYLFALKAKALAYSALGIAILIAIPLVILAYYLNRYASFYIILANGNLKMSLESAYEIFAKNIKESLLLSLITIITGFLLMISSVLLCLLLIVIFGIFGFIAYLIFAKIGAIVLAVVGAVVFLAILAVVFSWYEAFIMATWLFFFQQISFQKTDKKNLTEKVMIEGDVPNPEAV